MLIRTPYGRTVMGPLGRLYAERGYQVIVQSCRGTFGSEGEFVPVRNEQADGRATLEWVAAQPWFDGRLVMWGGSYLGMTQWAVAQDAPDYLRAISPQVTASNFRDSVVFPGGAFALETALAWLHEIKNQELGWRSVLRTHLRGSRVVSTSSEVLPLGACDTAAIGEPMPFFQDWLAHSDPGDPWWDGRGFRSAPRAGATGQLHRRLVRPLPAVTSGGLRGAPPRRAHGPPDHRPLDARQPRVCSPRPCVTDPGGSTRNSARATDRHHDAPVRVFVMGSRTWQEFSMWPPAGETERWYLGRGGTLTPDPPAESAPDRYHYNPNDPTPAVGGPSLNMTTAGRKDQRRREQRRDVLTYTSPVLTDDLTVIGPLTTRLYVRSSLEHADFFVRLCDVNEKGKSHNLSDGIVRLAPGSVEKQADGVAALDIAMWPTANTFRAGHRIRLQVSSGAHPLFNRNAGTGEPLATGANLRSADQEVFHDGEHPSSIALHVVPLLQDGPLGGRGGERGMGSPDPLG